MPVTLRAPPVLLPPLKEPVAVVLGEELDVPDPLEGVDVLLMVVPRLEVVREGGPPLREEPVPEEEGRDEDEDKEEETGSAMSNAPVWESVLVTSPTGEAWKV